MSDLGDPGMAAVVVRGGTKRFGTRAVLDQLDFEIRRGEFVALLGTSGTGKTTLLRILAGLDRVDEGFVRVPEARSVVFQEPRLVPSQRVWKNVLLGRSTRGADRAAADRALVEVGLTSHRKAWPGTLSGGEAQRVALARALVREPGLLLLDEPFAALDALTRIRMQELVRALCDQHHPAVLFVTHDVDEALLLADRVAVLRDGVLSVDLTVGLPLPRRRSDPGFGELRMRLLGELGVPEADRPAAADAVASPAA